MDESNVSRIYALVDADCVIRYVGMSKHHLKKRLWRHLADACKGQANARCEWLRKQIELGRAVTIAELEVTSISDAAEREKYWIAHGISLGWPLTNETSGGNGTPGRILSREAIAKISEVFAETRKTPEWKKNFLWAMEETRGRKKSPEHRAKISLFHANRTPEQRAENNRKVREGILRAKEKRNENLSNDTHGIE